MSVALNVIPDTPSRELTAAPRDAVAPFKIVLADPPAKDDDYDKAYPNLGLLQLISYVREQTPLHDEDILFLDQFNSIEDHLRMIEEHKPRIYGLSFAFLTQRIAYDTINEIKRRFPEVLIIAGGPHPTSIPETVLEKCAADIVCIGEGEMTLVDIIHEMLAGSSDFKSIPGLLLRTNDQAATDSSTDLPIAVGACSSGKTADGMVRTAKPRAYENLDELPFLAWDRIDFSKFVGQHYCKSQRQSCIVISRGCPYKCTFCSLPVWRAAKPYVRMRSPENIAKEVEWLYSLGVREIKVVSDEINITLPWAKEVCRAIANLGHKDLFFQSNLRADKVDEELAELFKRMNMWVVHLGVESANDRVLTGIEKKITVAQTERCLKFLKKHDIRVLLYMMAFQLWEDDGELQFETPREVRRSLGWIWKQFFLRRVNYMTWSIATPMPGAPLQEIVDRHGLHSSAEVLDNWNRNKDYLGIDLTTLGISNRKRMQMLRLGILTKASFALISGNFDWRRHFYRVGILMRSFLGRWSTRPTPRPKILNTPLRTKVEG